MNLSLISRIASTLTGCLSAASAFAHEGHSHAGAHWHASDTLGFLLVAVLAATAVWLSRK